MRVAVYANDNGDLELRINGELVPLTTAKVDYCDAVGEVFLECLTDDFADGGAWVYHSNKQQKSKRIAK